MVPVITEAELTAKARGLYPGLPVLVATGFADMGAIEGALGGKVVLCKPFQLSDLVSAVARLTEPRSALLTLDNIFFSG